MYTKQDLFFYFVLKLKEKYNRLNPEIKLDRYYILKMLFIACIRDNNLLHWLGDNNNFNNFYAMENWPVESSCYNYIYNFWLAFEVIVNDLKLIETKIEQDIDNDIKIKIKEAVDKISDFLFLKDSDYLIDYTHTFNSWKRAWEKCKIYQKRAYPININDIENDWKY